MFVLLAHSTSRMDHDKAIKERIESHPKREKKGNWCDSKISDQPQFFNPIKNNCVFGYGS